MATWNNVGSSIFSQNPAEYNIRSFLLHGKGTVETGQTIEAIHYTNLSSSGPITTDNDASRHEARH